MTRQDLSKRLAALGVSLVMLSSLSGCKKNKDIKISSDGLGFIVSEDDPYKSKYNGFYEYIINSKYLYNSKFNASTSADSILFAKELESKKYDKYNESQPFLISKVKIIWPDCFSNYNSRYGSYFDFIYEVKKLKSTTDETYDIIYSKMVANKDIEKFGVRKGEYMASTAIYCNDNLVSYTQVGIGSECGNVINEQIGDATLAISKISDNGLLRANKDTSYEDLIKAQEEFNYEVNAKGNYRVKK